MLSLLSSGVRLLCDASVCLRRPAGVVVWTVAALAFTVDGMSAQQPSSRPSATAGEAVLTAFQPGEGRELTIQPGHPEKFTVTVPPRQMVVLTLEQRVGMSGMIATSRSAAGAEIQTPGYTSDGGRGSRVRLALIGEENATENVVAFKTREKHRASVAEISLSTPLSPSEADLKLAALEANYAQAEAIRRGVAQDPPTKAEAIYDAVIAGALALRGTASPVSSPADLERRARTGKARLLMYREENYLAAEEAARHAVEMESPNSDPSALSLAEKGELALAWKTYSSALALLNRYNEAVEASRRALGLYEQTGDEYWQGVVVGNLAFVYRETGQTRKAMEAAEQSLKLAGRQKDDYGRAFALSAEGAILQGTGDYQAALDRYYRALDVVATLKLSQPHPQVEGEIWSNMGEIYADLADWEQAENAYRHALPVLEAASDGVNEIEVEGRLAASEAHAGKLDVAEKDYTAALKRADEQQLLRQKAHLLVGLARVKAAEGDHGLSEKSTAVKELFEQAEAQAREIQQIDGEADALSGLGDLLSVQGHQAEARKAYERSAELWGQIPNALEVARARANLARLDRQSGQLTQASQEILAALDQIEWARGTLASESLRTSYFSSRHSFYELAIDALMELNDVQPGQGYAAQAWAIAERARARTLLDELAAGARTSKLNEQQQALEVRIRETEDRLAHLSTKKEDVAKAKAAGQELHQLLMEADRAAQEARSQQPDNGTPAPGAESALRLDQLINIALGKDTALYEYWVGSECSYLWVIRAGETAGAINSYILPGATTLQERVNDYLDAVMQREQDPAGETLADRERRLASADRKANRLSEEMGQLLLPLVPVEDSANPLRRLVIVPDGPLEALPYAAMRLRTRRGVMDSHGRAASYLIQQYEVVEEPSAASLLELGRVKQTPDGVQPRQVAVFADPVYSKTDPRVRPAAVKMVTASVEGAENQARLKPGLLRQAGDGIALPQLPRLPGSKREALDIQEIAGRGRTVMFVDFDASPAALARTDWTQYRILHIAAHAIANQEQPELSGIVLSMVGPDGAPVNGVVRLHDVYHLHTPVELVVLSACSTSGGKTIAGEGVEGLARAFLVAGARSVLATQWAADDASASELMQSFYSAYLRDGESSPAALRAAQIRLIESSRHSAPYYWAGAVLEGGWQAQ